MDDKVQKIIRLEADASKMESEASDLRWEAARLISEEIASGTTQRALAKEIGKDHKHVAWCVKCWKIWGGDLVGPRPPFNKAYHSTEVRGGPKPKVRGKPKARPEIITDGDDIRGHLDSGTFRELLSQGKARWTETADRISLVVQKR